MNALRLGMGTPPRKIGNRVILKIGRAIFWMAVNRNLRRAMMRGGESQESVSDNWD